MTNKLVFEAFKSDHARFSWHSRCPFWWNAFFLLVAMILHRYCSTVDCKSAEIISLALFSKTINSDGARPMREMGLEQNHARELSWPTRGKLLNQPGSGFSIAYNILLPYFSHLSLFSDKTGLGTSMCLLRS
jgi:hypothetical protein